MDPNHIGETIVVIVIIIVIVIVVVVVVVCKVDANSPSKLSRTLGMEIYQPSQILYTEWVVIQNDVDAAP